MSLGVPFIGPPEKKSFSKLRAPWLSTRCRRAVINRLACGLKHRTTLHMLLESSSPVTITVSAISSSPSSSEIFHLMDPCHPPAILRRLSDGFEASCHRRQGDAPYCCLCHSETQQLLGFDGEGRVVTYMHAAVCIEQDSTKYTWTHFIDRKWCERLGATRGRCLSRMHRLFETSDQVCSPKSNFVVLQ